MVIHAEDKFLARRKEAEKKRTAPPVTPVDDKNAMIAMRLQEMLKEPTK